MRSRIVGGVFLILSCVYWWTQYQPVPPGLDVSIFDFEKQSLKEVVIHQPDQEVRMIENNGTWTLVQADNEASTTMVNRSKHQLHRLKARSIVERNPVDLDNYGLGNDAIQVDLSLRGGQKESLLVGGANPTGVSYYMMPLSGPHKGSVLTVAKASVDFFGSELSDFRAEHFVQFDLQSADSIEIVLSEAFVKERQIGTDERTWVARRSVVDGVQFWDGGFTDEPTERISAEFMRRLLGRYLALKSKGYKGVVEVSDADAGLDTPIVSVVLSGSGVNLNLQIGTSISDGLRYFSVNGLTERVMARDGLLEDYDFSPSKVQNPRRLDFLESTLGLIQMNLRVGDVPSVLKRHQHWELNGVEIEDEGVHELLTHASTLRVVEWRDDSTEWSFTPCTDGALPSRLTIEHKLRSIELKFGEKIQRNMALTPTEPPQIVEYRQIRLDVDDSSRDVLIEEHWVADFVSRYKNLQQSKEDGKE